MVIVYTDALSEGQRASCLDCSAYGQDYRSTIPIPLCKLAILELKLRKTPTYDEAQNEGIDPTGIPENCGNEYISLPNREVR